jgi:predicted MFS family arabinose efflux permease
MASFVPLLVLFSFTALLESMAVPAANAIAVDRGRELGMGSVMGLFNMSMAVGLLLGSVLGGLVQDFLGVDSVFRFSALVMLGGIGVIYTLMKRGQRSGTQMSE